MDNRARAKTALRSDPADIGAQDEFQKVLFTGGEIVGVEERRRIRMEDGSCTE